MLTKNNVYVAMMLAMVALTLSYIDSMIPNSLWYYVETYMPF